MKPVGVQWLTWSMICFIVWRRIMPELRWSVPASRGSLSAHEVRTKTNMQVPLVRSELSHDGALPTRGLCTAHWGQPWVLWPASQQLWPHLPFAPTVTTEMSPDGQMFPMGRKCPAREPLGWPRCSPVMPGIWRRQVRYVTWVQNLMGLPQDLRSHGIFGYSKFEKIEINSL